MTNFLYDYNTEPFEVDLDNLWEFAKDVTTGWGTDKETFRDAYRPDIEDRIEEAVTDHYEDENLDYEDLNNYIGDAIEEDFDELADELLENYYDEFRRILEDIDEYVTDALREFR